MNTHSISGRTVATILFALFTALILRSWLQVTLVNRGHSAELASELAYLVVPFVLLLILFPLWRAEKPFLRDLFDRQKLTWRLAGIAIVIGVLIRIAARSLDVARVSFGLTLPEDPNSVFGPVWSFSCPGADFMILSFIVSSALIPVIEETVHRGYVQTFLHHRGPVVAIVCSSLVFTVFHVADTWLTVFLIGVVLGSLFWITRSLWLPMIVHGTYNGLILLDWVCLNVRWNPSRENLPLLKSGVPALLVLALSVSLLIWLLRRLHAGAPVAPR